MTSVPPIASLRRFVRTTPAEPRERCDLCSAALRPGHRHLFEPTARRLICTCDGCALLFPSGSRTKYLVVPRRFRRLDDFQIGDDQWNALGIPIGLAFFSRCSATGSILATYPSPAGATQSELLPESWRELEDANPVLRTMEADVETLLVNRTHHKRDYYLAPIDRCYELAGLVRTNWRGLSGGSVVWEAIDRFFNACAPVQHA